MTVYEGYSIDIEADGFIFESKNIWTIVCTDLNDNRKKIVLNPFKDPLAKGKLEEFTRGYSNPYITFHFGMGYDLFVLLNILGAEHTVGPDTFMGMPVQFVDTFYMSMYLNPDRAGHSVEYFGECLGLPKIDFRKELVNVGFLDPSAPKGAEFMQYHPLMDTYCIRDTEVDVKIFQGLCKEWKTIYGTPFSHTQSYKCGQKSFYLMSCQELTGFKFDIEKANALATRIAEMMEQIRSEVEPKLPPRSLKKTEQKEYTMPAKPFKKDGSYSSTWEKFVEKHKGEEVDGKWKFYGKLYKPEAGKLLDVTMPMEMANQDQMKDWFLEQGWVPTLFNYKRGPDGKPERDQKTRELIKTTPKIQEAGKICPNLLEMEGDIVKNVVKWLSLRNRQSVLQGWLDNDRLTMDGRIGAGRSGIASSHRQRHKTVVNVPKASDKVLLGHEFRELWTCEDGFLIAAADAAALEGRVQGHYTHRYDGGATADELLKGDVHSKNAFAFYGDIYEEVANLYTSPDFNKEDSAWKPYRDKSKNGFYAILYGASGPKVASTLGIEGHHGQAALEAFWDANPGTKALKDNLEKYWEAVGQKKYLPAIDGRMLCTRKKSALLNTIFQSCGGIAMDYALCFMDMWLGKMYWEDRKPYYVYKGYKVRRVGYWHDEAEFEAEEPIAQEVGDMVVKAIVRAGEFLKLQVPLAGEAKVGKSWRSVH